MTSLLVPVMAFFPEPNLDYSLIGSDFSLTETYLDDGQPAGEKVLRAAKARLEAIFPGAIVNYDVATGKVSMTASGVDRAKAEAFLDALRMDIRFAQI